MNTPSAYFILPLPTLAAFFVLVLLSSCSSSPDVPLETNYYLLNSQHLVKPAVNINKTVVVQVLELPAYLHQPHLVIQLNEHQLHYARFDMWAESLQAGLSKALINDLNLNNKHIQFITDEFQPGNNDNNNKLIVRIDYFHPSAASKVVLSGVFWQDNNDSQGSVQHPFMFELLLNKDGYTHAVAQMRQLVSMMSAAILLDSY